MRRGQKSGQARSGGQMKCAGPRTTAADDGARGSPAARKRASQWQRKAELPAGTRDYCQSPQRTAPGSRTSAARRWQRRQRRRYPRRRHRLRVCIATVSKGPPDSTAPAAIAKRRTRRLIAHPGRGGAAALAAHAGAACDKTRAKASACTGQHAARPSANKQQRGVRAFAAGDGALLRREPATSNGHAHARQPANIHSLPWSSTAAWKLTSSAADRRWLRRPRRRCQHRRHRLRWEGTRLSSKSFWALATILHRSAHRSPGCPLQ